jgi:ribosome production factor 1
VSVFRYAFRSPEKVQLQEIGPRFTLKLRSLRKGLPAVKNLGEVRKDLEFDTFEDDANQEDKLVNVGEQPRGEQPQGEDADTNMERSGTAHGHFRKVLPPKEDEYVWTWKVCKFFYRLAIGFRQSC